MSRTPEIERLEAELSAASVVTRNMEAAGKMLQHRAEAAEARTRELEADDRIGWLEQQREEECKQKLAALAESEMCLKETKQLREQSARLRAAAQESLQFATDLQTNNGMLVMRIEKLRAQLKAALAAVLEMAERLARLQEHATFSIFHAYDGDTQKTTESTMINIERDGIANSLSELADRLKEAK